MEIVSFESFERLISWELYDRFDLEVEESKYSLGPIYEHSRWLDATSLQQESNHKMPLSI